MITIRPDLKVLVAAQPVDFRKGMEALAGLVADRLRENPYAGTIFVFRSKRAHRASFRIPFGVRAHRLPLASPLWASPAGRTAHDAQSG